MLHLLSAEPLPESGTERGSPDPFATPPIGAAGIDWHVETSGSGPVLLLIHGTGSSAHTWRELTPALAEHFRVIAPDLPGHGASSLPRFERLSLPAMAAALAQLVRALRVEPVMAVGHSAGAAILVQMALDRTLRPAMIASVNGALLPFAGVPGWLFAPLAKLLVRSALLPRFMARRAADPAVIERLLADTGSRLEPAGVERYRRLAQQPKHVAGALGMMANWDLRPLERRLPTLGVPLRLLTGERDRTISPRQAERVRALVPEARIVSLGPVGHLAHEERPLETAAVLVRLAREGGALA